MKQRPETLPSKTTQIPTGYGTLYVTVSEFDGLPFEVFCTIGKSGKSIMAKSEVIGRLVSLALRHDVPLPEVIGQLADISGEQQVAWKDGVVKSIPDAVGKVLRNYLPKEEDNE